MSSDTATQSPQRAIAVVHGQSMLTDSARFEHTYRVAKVFAGSQLIPSHLRTKTEDVMIALHVADRLGEDPLTVMQNIYVVQGRAGWSSTYMIARINRSGLIRGRITWDVDGKGKDLAVTAKATLADTGEVVSATATMEMALADGWTRNPKYQSMPDHMLKWRAAAMLQRLYFPEVMLGMPTAEELEDTAPLVVKDVTPAEERPTAAHALAAFAKRGGNEDEIDRTIPVGTIVPQAQAEAPKPRGRARKTAAPEADAAPPPPPQREEIEVTEKQAGVRDDLDPDLYFDQIARNIDDMHSIEELDAAHDVVKVALADFPSHLGRWNALRIARMGMLRPK